MKKKKSEEEEEEDEELIHLERQETTRSIFFRVRKRQSARTRQPIRFFAYRERRRLT